MNANALQCSLQHIALCGVCSPDPHTAIYTRIQIYVHPMYTSHHIVTATARASQRERIAPQSPGSWPARARAISGIKWLCSLIKNARKHRAFRAYRMILKKTHTLTTYNYFSRAHGFMHSCATSTTTTTTKPRRSPDTVVHIVHIQTHGVLVRSRSLATLK